MGEEEVAAALRAVLAEVDRVPETAVQSANAAIGWRSVDAELVQLIAESGLESSHLRGGDLRLLTYRSGDTIIELEVSSDEGATRLLGQLDPPREAAVTVESASGRQSTRSDGYGRFSFTSLRAGWMRVIVAQAGAAAADGPLTGETPGRAATEWFRA